MHPNRGTSCVEQSHQIIWERAQCELHFLGGEDAAVALQRKPLEQKPQPAEMSGSNMPSVGLENATSCRVQQRPPWSRSPARNTDTGVRGEE